MIEFRDALAYSLEELSQHFTHCFEDYVIPANFTASLLSFLIRVDGADLANSVLAVDGDEVVGILMVCRRGNRIRIGAMAVAKRCRSQGLGAELMTRALKAARERGETHAVLEAIEHNTRAIAFYMEHGFAVRCRLVSASIPLEAGHGKGKVNEICLRDMAAQPILRDDAVSTWEMNSTSVGQMAHPIVGYECEGLFAAVALRAEENVVCFSLALSGEDDAHKLRALVSGLGEFYPGCSLRIPPYYPEPTFLGLFESTGLEIGALSQFLMERNLR